MTRVTFPEDEDLAFIESYSSIYSKGCDEKPFGDISAEEYFRFAKMAQNRKDTVRLVDALGNAKRCLHYQIDRLLYRYGLYDMAKKSNFQEKTQLLSELNIIPSTLLRIFNKERNLMEHDYTIPDKETVDAAIDLCDLLFLATERFLQITPEQIRIKFKNDKRDLVMKLKAGTNRISVLEVRGSKLTTHKDGSCYLGVIYPLFDFDKIVEGIEVVPLEHEDILIHKSNKDKWLPLLKVFADEARRIV